MFGQSDLEQWLCPAHSLPAGARYAPPAQRRGSARPVRNADVVYRYDVGFEGFLCCVFESFSSHEVPFAVWTPERETTTLYPVKQIETDPQKAGRVFASFAKKLGKDTERLIMTCFLSGRDDKEVLMLRFLHLAYATGPGVLALLGHPDVAPMYAMQKHTAREVEKWMGFIRFEESGGMLGAVIHPKNYVLPLLKNHFCNRFPEENFLIYDATHMAVLLYQDHKATLTELAAPLTLPSPDEKESYYQQLWKQFYNTLAIQQRRNEKCRRTLCPKRYWADMTELRDEL
ncbi:MAG: TIGR03915 family putative DNA repair protein [Faecalibacterium sp.]|nr:TIGR03915 family putative DNA repair protein [Faecalibacterium sp.]